MSAGPNFNTSMPSLLLNPNHHQVAFTARVQHLGEQCNASCVGRWLAVLKGGCDGVSRLLDLPQLEDELGVAIHAALPVSKRSHMERATLLH
jgi:hypothetical protein